MRTPIIISMLCITFFSTSFGYTNLTPSQVHSRLVAGDTLLILDVREWSEYSSGHIAEPSGYLPLTQACMPWNSGVLSAEYGRFPADIDIIVYCASGGRSAAASSFLEGQGFTRIFNMTGGFSSWSYESRTGGFGDHSGVWVHPTDTLWLTQPFDFLYPTFHRGEDVLRRWYNAAGFDYTDINESGKPKDVFINAFPNPFNSSCKITLSAQEVAIPCSLIDIAIFDLRGNVVYASSIPHTISIPLGQDGVRGFVWTPDKTISSGIYFVRARMGDGNYITK